MNPKNILTLTLALGAMAVATYLAINSLSVRKFETINQVDKPGYFFAETAANFIYWAFQPSNDRELDGFDPEYPVGSKRFGDLTELRDPYRFSSPEKQLKYFLNQPIDYSANENLFVPGRELRVMLESFSPPPHLRLNIDPKTGEVSLPAQNFAEGAKNIPQFGAIVWLSASFMRKNTFIRHDSNHDGVPDQYLQNEEGQEIFLDTERHPVPSGADMYIHSGVDSYGLTAYIIAYFDSEPVRMLRVVLGRIDRLGTKRVGAVPSARKSAKK